MLGLDRALATKPAFGKDLRRVLGNSVPKEILRQVRKSQGHRPLFLKLVQGVGTDPCCAWITDKTVDVRDKPRDNKVFEQTCDVECYRGYSPVTSATYECVDDPGKTTGKWKPPTEGQLSCTGNPCKSAAPQDAPGERGNPVEHSTFCERAEHYDRSDPVTCNHGNGADQPCELGYNYNGHLQGSKDWDQCECFYTSTYML